MFGVSPNLKREEVFIIEKRKSMAPSFIYGRNTGEALRFTGKERAPPKSSYMKEWVFVHYRMGG